MKQSCCRSTPRCTNCPVRLAAAVRMQRELGETAALVSEIFAGRPPRPLPAGVTAALERLHAARVPPAA